MTMAALHMDPRLERGVTPRAGSPRRTEILTALWAAAMRDGNLKAVLMLARTGRPRSLASCAGKFRWLALAGLKALYPDASDPALRSVLGCRSTADPRLAREREMWPPDLVDCIARDVAENVDAQLTAAWVWPTACAVAAGETRADPVAVATPTGSRASLPKAVSTARQMAVYLTMTEGDVNATAMAAATGLNKETVRHAVGKIEDARDDDAALDALIDRLAAELRGRLDEELSQW